MAEEKKKDRGNVREWLNPLASMFDRELRQGAERLASAVPKDSPLRRSHLAERAFGAVASIVERLGKGRGPVVELVSEKSSDFMDRFSSALFGKEGKQKEAAVAASGWFNEATKRMSRARDPQWMFNRLQQEFELRRKLIQMLEQAAKEAEEATKAEERPAAPPIDWAERFRKLREEAEAHWARFSAWAQAGWQISKPKLQEADVQAAEQIFWGTARLEDWRRRQRWIRRRRPR